MAKDRLNELQATKHKDFKDKLDEWYGGEENYYVIYAVVIDGTAIVVLKNNSYNLDTINIIRMFRMSEGIALSVDESERIGNLKNY